MSSNPAHGEVYSIQHYVIKFVSDLRWFSPDTPVSSKSKTDRHDVTEILLNVALHNQNEIIINSVVDVIYFISTTMIGQRQSN